MWSNIVYICEYINFQNPYIMADTSSKTTERIDLQPEDSNKNLQSAEVESTPKTDSNKSDHFDDKKRTVTIEIVRHKRLFEILENPRAMWKVIASLFVVDVFKPAGKISIKNQLCASEFCNVFLFNSVGDSFVGIHFFLFP